VSVLENSLLEKMRERASVFDQENKFPDADITDLKNADYLKIALPEAFGGRGLSLAEVIAEQRYLAAYAPATALSVAMHQIINTVLATAFETTWMPESQKQALTQVFEAAAAGELFALGISEIGNDQHLYDSKTVATKTADGYKISGIKNTVTAAGAFDSIVFHALDDENQELVYFFLPRNDSMKPHGTWDTLGMRASQSFGINFNETVAPKSAVLWKSKLGEKKDPFIGTLAKAFSLIVTSIYLGIGDRGVEIARDAVRFRESKLQQQLESKQQAQDAFGGDSSVGDIRAIDALARDTLGRAAIAVDAAGNHLLRIAETPSISSERPWSIAGAKTVVLQASKQAVQIATDLQGAGWFRAGSELERLSRDVLAGDLHPNKPSVARVRAADALLG